MTDDDRPDPDYVREPFTAVDAIRLLDSLKQRLLSCSVDEIRVVDVFLKRLEMGRKEYGPLDLSKPRDWRLEKAQERFDGEFYEACDVLVKEDERRQRAECEAADKFARENPTEFGLRELARALPVSQPRRRK